MTYSTKRHVEIFKLARSQQARCRGHFFEVRKTTSVASDGSCRKWLANTAEDSVSALHGWKPEPFITIHFPLLPAISSLWGMRNVNATLINHMLGTTTKHHRVHETERKENYRKISRFTGRRKTAGLLHMNTCMCPSRGECIHEGEYNDLFIAFQALICGNALPRGPHRRVCCVMLQHLHWEST